MEPENDHASCSDLEDKDVGTYRDKGSKGDASLLSIRTSRKWTEEEQEQLIRAVDDLGCGSEAINWAIIAKAVPTRSGKQCREKWRNDLRPDISKEPWASQEEYILARAHSEVGNQWADIAKYLPGRAENAIKNHWNATLRSKAEAKPATFLWVYGKQVLNNRGTTSRTVLERAVHAYRALENVEPIDSFAVDEQYIKTCKAAIASTAAAAARHLPPRAASTRRPRKKSRRWDSGSSDDGDSDWRDDNSDIDDDDVLDVTLPRALAMQRPSALRQNVARLVAGGTRSAPSSAPRETVSKTSSSAVATTTALPNASSMPTAPRCTSSAGAMPSGGGDAYARIKLLQHPRQQQQQRCVGIKRDSAGSFGYPPVHPRSSAVEEAGGATSHEKVPDVQELQEAVIEENDPTLDLIECQAAGSGSTGDNSTSTAAMLFERWQQPEPGCGVDDSTSDLVQWLTDPCGHGLESPRAFSMALFGGSSSGRSSYGGSLAELRSSGNGALTQQLAQQRHPQHPHPHHMPPPAMRGSASTAPGPFVHDGYALDGYQLPPWALHLCAPMGPPPHLMHGYPHPHAPGPYYPSHRMEQPVPYPGPSPYGPPPPGYGLPLPYGMPPPPPHHPHAYPMRQAGCAGTWGGSMMMVPSAPGVAPGGHGGDPGLQGGWE